MQCATHSKGKTNPKNYKTEKDHNNDRDKGFDICFYDEGIES